MNLEILNRDVQQFITANLKTPLSELVFLKNPFPTIDFKEIINQIENKKKAENKLPTWFLTDGIIYPTKISLEQTSSEIAAQYKASFCNGEILLDASGGFGIDDYYFAKKFKTVVHCEITTKLSTIVAHNLSQLNCTNITCIAANSNEYLKENKVKFDLIYVDPARRTSDNKKVFFLEDCEPNVPSLVDFYFLHTNSILVKTAPLLDISSAVQALKNVTEIHIVAINNEVKELLFKMDKNVFVPPIIKTINITKNYTDILQFDKQISASKTYSLPLKYLYEPNNAILKSGKFEEITHYFEVQKLQVNSHLYTSDSLIAFPGRIFEIKKTILCSKAMLKQNLFQQKANITIRNFPDTVENIRKKYNIKDGGDLFCFFTTNKENAKIVLLCTKLN